MLYEASIIHISQYATYLVMQVLHIEHKDLLGCVEIKNNSTPKKIPTEFLEVENEFNILFSC